MKIGKCSKCGEIRPIGAHHIKGYLGENLNITLPYCYSCDRLAHIKARKEGKCLLSFKQINVLSNKSSNKRQHQNKSRLKIISRETVDTNIFLNQFINHYSSTGNITIGSCFAGNHKKKLLHINI
jgi:hypothetical protein